MTDIFEKIIETLVIAPIFIVALCLFLIALILFPFRKIRMWLMIQAIRIVDVWAFYDENKDLYFGKEKQDD
jgi:hypothetical protein